ncbi:O-methyltransferase [Arsenicicoccus dermatophilus]|uniref:O-methyltransferase n=1 Tax=Arsenicicoccus dermatophilus TaxID=1076331 RepID=UPI00391753D3
MTARSWPYSARSASCGFSTTTPTPLTHDPQRTAAAAETLGRAGLDEVVRLVTTDAGAHLAALPTASIDLIFLDAERPAYVGYWPDLRRSLTGRGTLVVDNVISHAEEVRDFIALVGADPDFAVATAPTGAGLLLATRVRGSR